MSQQQHQETELRRSSRTRNRKSYSDYFSDNDVLTEHDDDIEEQEDLEEEEDQDASDEEYIQEEGGEASDDSSDNDSDKEVSNEASVKDINPKFACGLCSNTLSDPYIIPACCHRFCCKCIQQSLKAGIGPCPTCRDHNVSFQSLRRDEMMGRLLARYKMLQEMIQKKKVEEETHETHRKHTLETMGAIEKESDRLMEIASPRTTKKRKIELSKNELSCKEDSDNFKSMNESDGAIQSTFAKKKATTHRGSKKKKPKSSHEVLNFEERLQCLREFQKKHGHCHVPHSHHGLGKWCSNMRMIKAGTLKQFKSPEFKLTKKRMKVLEDMGFKWTIVPTFDEYFQELQAFKERHGHCYVPSQYKENKRLGSWCARLRMIKAGTRHNPEGCCKLTPERIKRLDALGFRWWMKSQPLTKVDAKDLKFQEKIEISTVVESANVDATSTDKYTKKSTSNDEEDTPKKEQCVGEDSIHKETKGTSDDIEEMIILRKEKKKEKSTVTALKESNECRTGSNNDKSRKRKKQKKVYRSFDENFNALQSFKRKKGHCNVSVRNNTEDPSLANWVNVIRSMKAGRKKPFANPNTKLTEARIAKLDALGFEWTRGPSYHDRIDKFTFDDYVRDLKAYKAKHGDCYVSINDKDNKKLGRWVSKLRMLRAGTKQPVNHSSLQLTEERITELNSIGFKWRGFKPFDEYMDDLRQFKAKHGHCDVPFLYSDNKSLGFWVGKIRRKKLGKDVDNGSPDHKLTKERIAQLDKMGFNWRLR